MKNKLKFTMELIFTILVAGLLSTLLSLMLAFIAGNTGIFYQSVSLINTLTSVLFGLIIGYKLNTLLRAHRV